MALKVKRLIKKAQFLLGGLLFLMLFFVANKINAQSSDPIYDSICRLDFRDYMNRPVGEFIAALPTGYSEIKIYGQLKYPNRARVLEIMYPDRTEVNIKVKRYNFMEIEDPNRVWNLDLFKRENMFYVIVYSKNDGTKDEIAY